MTLLADVVTASRDLTHTSSRSQKVAILAELLRRADASGLAAAVGFLAGVPRQGRVGIGYSTIYGFERAPAGEASLTIGHRWRRRRLGDLPFDARRARGAGAQARLATHVSEREARSSSCSPAGY